VVVCKSILRLGGLGLNLKTCKKKSHKGEKHLPTYFHYGSFPVLGFHSFLRSVWFMNELNVSNNSKTLAAFPMFTRFECKITDILASANAVISAG
jgi:hypothetical protein